MFTCNVAASEEIVGERCVPSLIVINNTINQLESKVSRTTHCLRLLILLLFTGLKCCSIRGNGEYQVLLSSALPFTS